MVDIDFKTNNNKIFPDCESLKYQIPNKRRRKSFDGDDDNKIEGERNLKSEHTMFHIKHHTYWWVPNGHIYPHSTYILYVLSFFSFSSSGYVAHGICKLKQFRILTSIRITHNTQQSMKQLFTTTPKVDSAPFKTRAVFLYHVHNVCCLRQSVSGFWLLVRSIVVHVLMTRVNCE